MSYQIKRADRLIDTLEFVSKGGGVALQIDVNIEIVKVASRYRACWLNIIEAQKKLVSTEDGSPDLEEAMAALESAVLSTYGLLFGEQATQHMLGFFDGDVEEMLEQTLPFVRDVVVPAIQSYSEQRKQELKEKYSSKKRRA